MPVEDQNKKEIYKLFESLPSDLQEALWDFDMLEKITTASNLCGIVMDGELKKTVLSILANIFIGRLNRNQLSGQLQKKTNITPNKILIFSRILEKQILEPLKESLDQLEKQKVFSQEIINNPAPSNVVPAPTIPQAQKPNPTPITHGIHPIDQIMKLREQTSLAQKMSKINSIDTTVKTPVQVVTSPPIPQQNNAPVQEQKINPVDRLIESQQEKNESTFQDNVKNNPIIQNNPVIDLKNTADQSKLLSAMRGTSYQPPVLSQMSQVKQSDVDELKSLKIEAKKPIKRNPVPALEVAFSEEKGFKAQKSEEKSHVDLSKFPVTNIKKFNQDQPQKIVEGPIKYDKTVEKDDPFKKITETINLRSKESLSVNPENKIVYDYNQITFEKPNIVTEDKTNNMPSLKPTSRPLDEETKLIGNAIDLREN